MTDHTLLPCPFCGGKAGVIQLTGHASPNTVACDECHCRSCWGTEEEVIAAWNRRTQHAVPEGWVLVPREPTDGMIDKGESALVTGPAETELQDAPSATWAAAKACYRAMISAAPAAPTEAGNDEHH